VRDQTIDVEPQDKEIDHMKAALEKNITEKGDVIEKLRDQMDEKLQSLEEKG